MAFCEKPVRKQSDRSEINSFVLRGGRLTNLQQNALDRWYATYAIEFTSGLIDLEKVFGNRNPVIIEIGFGMGVSTAEIAAKFPDNNYLGIEVFLAGVGKLLDEIEERKLKNIRIIRFNAVDVLKEMIEDNSIAGFHIFFPDPWPKKKHHKRRLVQQELLELLTKKLLPGGYIYTVTDWEPYAEWMVDEFSKVKDLGSPHAGFSPPIEWRPRTKFEKKGLKKEHLIRELWYEKL